MQKEYTPRSYKKVCKGLVGFVQGLGEPEKIYKNHCKLSIFVLKCSKTQWLLQRIFYVVFAKMQILQILKDIYFLFN